jgi:peptide/nickel transport system ATP-binding protein
MPLLEMRGLRVAFRGKEVVHGVDLTVEPGEIVGIVGESGSGKTQTALAVAHLSRQDAQLSGEIIFDGVDLLSRPEKEVLNIQGDDIAMVFQEPMTSLNPTMRIGRQVEESLKLHKQLSKDERKRLALQALADAELPDPERIYRQYPHELSGGMRQRVMIAAAIVCNPKLLIADEPTTALDVTIQAEILKLLGKLNREKNMAILFISHDLRVIRRLCSRVAVMCGGNIVETGAVEEIFNHPREEYTKKLIASIPSRR